MMKENVMCTFCVINYEEKKNDNIIQDETHNIKREKNEVIKNDLKLLGEY